MSEKDELVARLRRVKSPGYVRHTAANTFTSNAIYVNPDGPRAADFIERTTRIEPEAADRGLSEAVVLRLAKALYWADVLDRNASGLHGSTDLTGQDVDEWWEESATMPTSGAGFVRRWTALAATAIQSLRSEHALPPVTNGERK